MNNANDNDLAEETQTPAQALDTIVESQNLWASNNSTASPSPTLPFGGLASSQERLPPVCKHLLACLLADACPEMFGGVVISPNDTGEAMDGVERSGGRAGGQQRTLGRKGVNVRVVGSLKEVAAWGGGGVFV